MLNIQTFEFEFQEGKNKYIKVTNYKSYLDIAEDIFHQRDTRSKPHS